VKIREQYYSTSFCTFVSNGPFKYSSEKPYTTLDKMEAATRAMEDEMKAIYVSYFKNNCYCLK